MYSSKHETHHTPPMDRYWPDWVYGELWRCDASISALQDTGSDGRTPGGLAAAVGLTFDHVVRDLALLDVNEGYTDLVIPSRLMPVFTVPTWIIREPGSSWCVEYETLKPPGSNHRLKEDRLLAGLRSSVLMEVGVVPPWMFLTWKHPITGEQQVVEEYDFADLSEWTLMARSTIQPLIGILKGTRKPKPKRSRCIDCDLKEYCTYYKPKPSFDEHLSDSIYDDLERDRHPDCPF